MGGCVALKRRVGLLLLARKMTPQPPTLLRPEDVAPGLSSYLWLLLAVVLVILLGLTFFTSTTHTRDLSKTKKVVFELLWLAVPLAAMIPVAVSGSYGFGGAVLIIGLIAVAVSFLHWKRKR